MATAATLLWCNCTRIDKRCPLSDTAQILLSIGVLSHVVSLKQSLITRSKIYIGWFHLPETHQHLEMGQMTMVIGMRDISAHHRDQAQPQSWWWFLFGLVCQNNQPYVYWIHSWSFRTPAKQYLNSLILQTMLCRLAQSRSLRNLDWPSGLVHKDVLHLVCGSSTRNKFHFNWLPVGETQGYRIDLSAQVLGLQPMTSTQCRGRHAHLCRRDLFPVQCFSPSQVEE